MTSNRHWPSLFKLKPSNEGTLSLEGEREREMEKEKERIPEPKPRWSPKPEQIQILESIFNSGMLNPSKEEIEKIKMKLKRYGQVEDVNIFYWFRNRQSRKKQKQRHLQKSLNDGNIIYSGVESGVSRSNASSFTVFINGIPSNIPMGPINVKALFGPNTVLFHSDGQPVLMDEQGFALQALQQGAMYYLMQI